MACLSLELEGGQRASVPIPAPVLELLQGILVQMSQGNAVTLVRPVDASYAQIWINALLKFSKHIDDCIPNFIDLIALPRNWQQ
jgi:hypothetical protein